MNTKFGLFPLLSRLGKGKQASGPRLLGRLLRDEEGHYLLIMTLAMPIFIGMAALAAEGGLIYLNLRTVKSAADAAAYSAAIAYSINSSADITTQAQAIVANYPLVFSAGNSQPDVVATVDTATYSPLTAINVTVTQPQLPFLSSIWVNSFSISGTAMAIISGGGGGGNGNCMLGLATTGTAIKLQGNSSIIAPGCGIFSNSDGSCSGQGVNFTPSIDLGGNGSIKTAGAVGAAGCVSVTGSSTIGPPPSGFTGATQACPTCADNPVIDPYANITPPAPSSTCIDAAGPSVGNISGKTAKTLNPGTYCNGISSTNQASVTLNPGTYILKNTANPNSVLTVDSQSTLMGNGVTLVFADPSGAAYPNLPVPGQGTTPTAMNISSGSTVNLQAPAPDATLGVPGMLMIGDTNMPLDTLFSIAANGVGSGIQGVIYLPKGDFSWQGTPIIAGGCTQMIAYRVFMNGNATFNNNNCNLSGGGVAGGAKPVGNVVTLVQ